jgi:phosphoribosylglycinamide formyltransferase-1
MMCRVGFCVSGQGRLFLSAVRHKTLLGIDPALVVADEKAATGLEDFCLRSEIGFVRLDSSDREEFDRRLTSTCIEARLDLIVLTFDKLLPKRLVESYPNRIINIHMSRLPAFKGFRAIPRAIEAGVKYLGATIHEVNNDMDAGSIISQCLVSVGPEDTEAAVAARLSRRLNLMYLQVIKWYAQGRVWRDSRGRVWVKDADYGDELVCPQIEDAIKSALAGGDIPH